MCRILIPWGLVEPGAGFLQLEAPSTTSSMRNHQHGCPWLTVPTQEPYLVLTCQDKAPFAGAPDFTAGIREVAGQVCASLLRRQDFA